MGRSVNPPPCLSRALRALPGLVSGTWQLDYVLTAGLIGVVDSGLTGADGTYPNVTTVGLRNLTGVVNGDQVTLWATTSTSSTSGDNGADPNKVVVITDQLSATTATAAVAAESSRQWSARPTARPTAASRS